MRVDVKTSFLALLFAASGVWPQASQARIIDRIAAVVNGEVITESEIIARAAPFLSQIDAEVSDPAANQARKQELLKETLRGLIDEKLLLQAAGDLQLSVTTEEVDRGVDQILKRNGLTLADLERALKEQGSSLKKYREEIRDQLLRLKVMSAKLQGKVNVTDEEALAACEADRKEFGATEMGLEVELHQIAFLLPEDASEADIQAKRDKAKEAIARADKGEDFAEIAKELSEVKTLSLGKINVDVLEPALAELLRKSPTGSVTQPIEMPGQILVLKIVDKQETQGPTCEAQLETYRAIVEERETEKALKSYLTSLRKKAHIEEKL